MTILPKYDPMNPYVYYRYMRESAPVSFDSATHTWSVFRYADVRHVLNTPSQFSSNPFVALPTDYEKPTLPPVGKSIIFMDDPQHKQVRSLVTQAFSPKRFSELEPQIATIVNNVLDTVLPQGSMDVVKDFAYPIPVMVIAQLLGIPTEDWTNFLDWSQGLLSAFAEESNPNALPDSPPLNAYLQQIITLREREPKDDIISTLVNAQVDGVTLTHDEIIGFLILLLVAGHETTANLFMNIFRVLDEYPEVMATLWVAPEHIPSMIEETLRYNAPVISQFRFAAQDTELSGQMIKRGHVILPQLASANRDEQQFPNPDQFDLYRSPNQHVAFGLGGIHFCLGAPLARLEARIALSLVLQRMKNIQRVRSTVLESVSPLFSGVKHLPITFKER